MNLLFGRLFGGFWLARPANPVISGGGYSPALIFSDARNSQYAAAIAF